MALNIPNVGSPADALMKGLNTGSTLYSRAMQSILEREKQKQAEEHFKQQMAMREKEFARSGANLGLQRALLMENLKKARNANNPMYEFNQYKALQDMLTGGQGGQGGQQNAQPMPTAETGEGMGMYSPEGLQEAQQQPQTAPSMPSGMSGGNLEALRQNPILRGFFKHKFGIDPLAEAPMTQEQKNASALNLFREKEAIKAQNKSGEMATNKVLTQNQQAVQAIDTVVPMIDELIANPSQIYGVNDFSPSKKAAYQAKTGGMIDMLVAAQSLPQVKESVNLVEQQIRRFTGETTDAYVKRLKDFRKDLMARRNKSIKVVGSKKVDTSTVLPEEVKMVKGKKYEKINGEWHEAD